LKTGVIKMVHPNILLQSHDVLMCCLFGTVDALSVGLNHIGHMQSVSWQQSHTLEMKPSPLHTGSDTWCNACLSLTVWCYDEANLQTLQNKLQVLAKMYNYTSFNYEHWSHSLIILSMSAGIDLNSQLDRFKFAPWRTSAYDQSSKAQ
jgi:hypothetical protein